jgi:hypothetical protein
MAVTPATVSPVTLRAYGRFPQMFRDADEAAGGYPLLTYLACQLEPWAALDALIDRLNYVPRDEAKNGRSTSDLVDPATGDPAWLPWQALVYGARIDLTAAVATQRAMVGAAQSWWARGSHDSIIAAAQTQLNGSKTCSLIPNNGGVAWTIGIQVIITEIATSDAAIIAAVDAADARPAGHDLVVVHYASSWDLQEARYPTWTAREAAGSWDVIESVH